MSQEKEAQFITPPNNLKNKVKYNTETSVDLEMLEKAEDMIAGMKDNYLDWVKEDLEKLQKAYDKAKSSMKKQDFQEVFEVAHDMKGQGGSFNYDLVTIVGNDLCRFIESVDEFSQSDSEIVKIHIDSIRLIVAKGLEGDGGEEGQQLLEAIKAVIDKYVGKPEEKMTGF
jgi:HPt (histidine-containing phosphotransfer) domain-containing protein